MPPDNLNRNPAFVTPASPAGTGFDNGVKGANTNQPQTRTLPLPSDRPGIEKPIIKVNPYIADVTRTEQARMGLIDPNPQRRQVNGVFEKGDLGPLPHMYDYHMHPLDANGDPQATKMLGFQTAIWASLQSIDPLIEKKLIMLPRFWHDRIPRGVFELHNGLVHQRRFFRGSLYKTVGLDNWEPIDPVPSISNDPCRFPKHSSVDYAWDQIAWSGMRAAWGSHPICANAFRYIADAAEQIALELEAGMEVGVRMQETFNRDFYVAQSVNFGRSYVMTHLMHGQDDSPRYYFDPFVKFGTTGSSASKTAVASLVTGSDGHPHAFVVIDASGDGEIEPLNWSALDRVHEMLKLRCPDAAIGNENGEPVFGLMVNNDDVMKSVEGDDRVYREWLEAKPQSLIDDYKVQFKTYRNWGIVSDPTQLRFKIKRYIAEYDPEDYGGVGAELAGKPVYIAIAVEPVVAEKKRKGINGGDIPTENIEYVDAELAIAPVFMNNVFANEFETQGQVNLKNGMTFGAFPALNGKWGWVRGPQTEADPFQQTGKFYGLFLIHPRPEARVYDTMSFIYRRCKESIRAKCPVENPRYNPAAIKRGEAADLAQDVTVAEALSAGETIEIMLAKGYGPLAIGDKRVLSFTAEGADEATDVTVVVVDITAAPCFTVALTEDVAAGTVFKGQLKPVEG